MKSVTKKTVKGITTFTTANIHDTAESARWILKFHIGGKGLDVRDFNIKVNFEGNNWMAQAVQKEIVL